MLLTRPCTATSCWLSSLASFLRKEPWNLVPRILWRAFRSHAAFRTELGRTAHSNSHSQGPSFALSYLFPKNLQVHFLHGEQKISSFALRSTHHTSIVALRAAGAARRSTGCAPTHQQRIAATRSIIVLAAAQSSATSDDEPAAAMRRSQNESPLHVHQSTLDRLSICPLQTAERV